MMGSYALIADGTVINTILWDGPNNTEISFGEGVEAVEITDSYPVNVGYLYSDGKFSQPPLTDQEIEDQKSTQIALNLTRKDTLMSESGQKISVLQDAVDLDIATDDEKSSLISWKKYRVILNRIDAAVSDEIDWPDMPSE